MFGISTSLIELTKSRVLLEFDNQAISTFLRVGFYVSADTPFKFIKALPPNCSTVWHEGKFTLRVNKIHTESNSEYISRDSAIQRYGQLFQTRMKIYLPENHDSMVLPLSGGADSRHILLALTRKGIKPDLFILMQRTNNNDSEIAGIICEKMNSFHKVLKVSDEIFHDEINKNKLTHLCTDEHAWLMPLRSYLNNKRFSIQYDGIAGDVLSGSLFLNKKRLNFYESGDFDSLAENILINEQPLLRVLSNEAYKKLPRSLAKENIMNELGNYSDCQNPIGQFHFWNRMRREISLSPYSILSSNSTTVLSPYLDNEIYNLLS